MQRTLPTHTETITVTYKQVNTMSTTTTHTTISGKEIKVRANHSKRSFTIKTDSGKYRTYSMDAGDFNDARRNWNGNDWQSFLNSESYIKL